MSDCLTRFGKTTTERLAEESKQAHEIVRELTAELQVSQRQILLIINGLALNLEDCDAMRHITDAVKNVGGKLFLIDHADVGGADGQSDR